MWRPILEGTVKRLTLAKLIGAQFFIFLILLGVGLQLVKHQLEGDATKLASVTAEATRYNANRQTCLARSIVDASVAGTRRSLKIAKAVAADKGRAPEVRKTARASIRNYGTTIDSLLKFRNTYGTIPPNYDCSKLPKDPPPLATNGGYR